MVLQNPVTQSEQFYEGQKNRKLITIHIIQIFQVEKYLKIAFREFKVISIKVLDCKMVDFAWGASVTNSATMFNCKRTTCEKKKNLVLLDYIWSQMTLRWESSLVWANSLNVDFLFQQNAA